jgi:hypothetical protein
MSQGKYILQLMLAMIFVVGGFLWMVGLATPGSPISLVGFVMFALDGLLILVFELANWENYPLVLIFVVEGFLSVALALFLSDQTGLLWWVVGGLSGPVAWFPLVWVLVYGISSAFMATYDFREERKRYTSKAAKAGRNIVVIDTRPKPRIRPEPLNASLKATVARRSVLAIPVCTIVATVVAFEIWSLLIPPFFSYMAQAVGLPSVDSYGINVALWVADLFIARGPWLLLVFSLGLLFAFGGGLLTIALVKWTIDAIVGPRNRGKDLIASGEQRTQENPPEYVRLTR